VLYNALVLPHPRPSNDPPLGDLRHALTARHVSAIPRCPPCVRSCFGVELLSVPHATAAVSLLGCCLHSSRRRSEDFRPVVSGHATSILPAALTDAQTNEGRMRVACVNIRNNCEFQADDLVQTHAVIFNFFGGSLRTEGPLLPNHLSPFPSSNRTMKRKLLCSCDHRFPEYEFYAPDSGWPAERNSNDLWTGRCGAPAGFAIRLQDVLHGRVSSFGGHTDFGNLRDAEKFTT
jgi:hypothetical protein